MTKTEIKKIMKKGGKVVSPFFVVIIAPEKERNYWGLQEAEVRVYGDYRGFYTKYLTTSQARGLLASLPRKGTKAGLNPSRACYTFYTDAHDYIIHHHEGEFSPKEYRRVNNLSPDADLCYASGGHWSVILPVREIDQYIRENNCETAMMRGCECQCGEHW